MFRNFFRNFSRQTQFATGTFSAATVMGLTGSALYLNNNQQLNQMNVANCAALPQEQDPYFRSRNSMPINDIQNFTLIAGTASQELASKISDRLNAPLARGSIKQFADGETSIKFDQKDVSQKHVYIVQSTQRPVNDNLMELLLLVSACRRSGAQTITVVTPYYGYARQDRRFGNQCAPVSSADVAQLLEHSGANRIITVDLHALQAQGYTHSVQFDNYEGAFAGLGYFLTNCREDKQKLVVVSPDAGGMHRAKQFHSHFGYHGWSDVGLAMIHKERKEANQVDSMQLIGEVKGKTCIIVDDMIDTAGTLCKAAQLLKDQGASKVYAFASHGIFSGKAKDNIAASCLEKVITTDSMLVTQEFQSKVGDKFQQVSLDLLLAEAIRRTHQKEDCQPLLTIPVY